MTKLYIVLILFSIAACSRIQETAETNVFFDSEEAQWIEDGRALPSSDSLFYLDNPSPLFRREFKPDEEIEHAKLFITAAGYYHASINGKRIGKNVLDPAWTDFSKRIYYTEYDVTALISEGDNCLGVSLGNGFYNPLPLRMWGSRNLRETLSVGKPAFIAKLQINYVNGESEEIVSDTTWKYTYGPIMNNSVYLGTTYDANKEINEWDTPGFEDNSWDLVRASDGPGGRLQKSFSPPVQIVTEITPVKISAFKQGIYMVDMGVNFTGTYKIKLSGNKGDTITFRFGERIYDDGSLNPMTTVIGQIKRKGSGGPGAPDIAWQMDRYIIGDKYQMPWFSPEFTYHTYRYMEIAGLDRKTSNLRCRRTCSFILMLSITVASPVHQPC